MKYKIKDLYNLDETIAKDLLEKYEYPWEALQNISDFIIYLGNRLDNSYTKKGDNIWIANDAKIYESAYINGPCIIDHEAEIRHCAFIRGNAIVGKNCVVGNSCELKNVILFNNVQTPHYNYVGDSILGYKAHMGAGSITSNVKGNKSLVEIDKNKTNLKKVGAFLGDYTEIGCNVVLNPGTIVGKNTQIYPINSIRGIIPEDSIYKNKKDIVKKVNHE